MYSSKQVNNDKQTSYTKKRGKNEKKRERQNVPIRHLFPHPVLFLDFSGAPLPNKGNNNAESVAKM